ncbi:HAMP domain-containing histidine kinase [Iamia sp. SCSIO 61187]|uniref:HAMP domain-containing sensor histidine kinase n=1 Tax=Iamia sp. SCSIO 61187 TaxID=2722752 RepID=UPI001C62CB51|nr:HAMP domain-containing sensor histidine kinase [Iamia sp. SCSIO 61187]QYG92174.1 HAMP domain-containing histidine kinase [Iamia sp. SCSIO 61187]
MSLRLRLLLGLGVVAVVLVVVAVVVTRSTRDDLEANVDEQLRSLSDSALAAAPYMTGERGFGGTRPPWARPGAAGDADGGVGFGGRAPTTIWVGLRQEGDIVTGVALLDADGDEVAPDLTAPALAELRPGQLVTVPGVGADRFRVIARGAGDRAWVYVGAPLDDVDASVRQLVLLEVAATAVVLGLLALVALWVLRLGVRPLKRMTATATAIGAGDLSQRVPEADRRTEAGELGAALNSMLTHIEEAFAASAASEARLRRFVADASHELRTPITTIRGYAELHRRGGLEDPEARSSAMARTEQEAVRMGRLVDDLLLLARLDQGRPLEAEPVDLGALAADARDDAAVAHPDHPVALDAAAGCTVVGDDHRLRQVVANLVGNAVTHTPAGTAVTVRVARADDRRHVLLEVADDGPGMPPELAERAFERFARGDVARSRAAGSTGLGLSIVQAIVAAHGGSVSLTSTEGEGTAVRVLLPAAEADPA